MGYTNRKEIPEKYKWNLSDIYATEQLWEEAFNKVQGDLVQIEQFKGKLNNKKSLLDCFNMMNELDKQFAKLYCYAAMSYDEDSQDADKQQRFSRVYSMLVNFEALSSFISPEISALSNEQLDEYIADKDFADYDIQLKKLRDGKAIFCLPTRKNCLQT